ncbi:hypothetical protein AGRA3207_001992 [Actinomadura graeca]|uniref:Uncharacterized protein n=1 Tax=Actinomadura graeca TaxID=2750812 RepID=A0ABX8QR43_9ACTN|nr:hypothetical protein [Actinomadura graeca]QXJ21166.1 hypothetical protein AGRA3207_001992 [Actinomadura graeca]
MGSRRGGRGTRGGGGVIGRAAARFLRRPGRHRGPFPRGAHRNNLGGATPKRPHNPRDIQNRWGIRRKDQKKFQDYADRKKLQIDVRPVNPESLKHLKHGNAIPKPQFVKSKTINDYDVMLKPDLKGKEGQVGYFKPDPPPKTKPDGMSDKDWDGLNDRYRQRHKEYYDQQGAMEEYGQKGKLQVGDDGVVRGTDPRDGQTKPFAGDNDLYDVRHHPGGERLTPDEYKQTVQEMMDNDMGVNHGAHKYWVPENDVNQGIWDKIEYNHSPDNPNMEPVVRFTPNQPVSVVGGDGAPI